MVADDHGCDLVGVDYVFLVLMFLEAGVSQIPHNTPVNRVAWSTVVAGRMRSLGRRDSTLDISGATKYLWATSHLSIFETGIKAVDLLAPYRRGAGVGKTVLIMELIKNIAKTHGGVSVSEENGMVRKISVGSDAPAIQAGTHKHDPSLLKHST